MIPYVVLNFKSCRLSYIFVFFTHFFSDALNEALNYAENAAKGNDELYPCLVVALVSENILQIQRISNLDLFPHFVFL